MREHRCSRQQANGLLFHGEPRATPEIPSSRNSSRCSRPSMRRPCAINAAIGREPASRGVEAETDVVVLDDVTPRYLRVNSALQACQRPSRRRVAVPLGAPEPRALDTRRGHVRGTGSNIPIFYRQRPEIFPMTSAGPAKSRGSIPERTGHRTLLRCGAAYPSADHDCGTGELRICHRHQRAMSLRWGRHRASCGRHARLLLLGLALEKLDIHFRAVHPD